MQKDDEAIQQYQSLNPKPMPFTCLVRLDMRLYQLLESDEKEQVIEVWLGQPSAVSDPQRLRLTFYGAHMATSCHVCPGMNLYIEIVSIRERQWNDLFYAVMDLEGRSELFYCRSFEAKCDKFSLDSIT
jgi:hypothetical protein